MRVTKKANLTDVHVFLRSLTTERLKMAAFLIHLEFERRAAVRAEKQRKVKK